MPSAQDQVALYLGRMFVEARMGGPAPGCSSRSTWMGQLGREPMETILSEDAVLLPSRTGRTKHPVSDPAGLEVRERMELA